MQDTAQLRGRLPAAAACANFTGKTSTLFPIAALWTLYCFPRAPAFYVLGPKIVEPVN